MMRWSRIFSKLIEIGVAGNVHGNASRILDAYLTSYRRIAIVRLAYVVSVSARVH
jgi:hypothetical protein